MSIAFPDPSESPWTNPETGLIYEYVDGMWRPQDSSGGGGGNGGGGSGGGGGGGNIGTFSMNSRISHFAPSGLIESCGMAKIGDTIVAAGLPSTRTTWNGLESSLAKFAVSTDGGKSWTQVDCPVEAYQIDSLTEGDNGKFYAITFFTKEIAYEKKICILESSNGFDWTTVNELSASDTKTCQIASLTFVDGNLILTLNKTSSTSAYYSTDYGRTLEYMSSMQLGYGYSIDSRLGLPDGGAIIFTSHSTYYNYVLSPGSLDAVRNGAAKGHHAITKSGRILRADTSLSSSSEENKVYRTKNPIMSVDDYKSAEWEVISTFGIQKFTRLLTSVDLNGKKAEVLVFSRRGSNGGNSPDNCHDWSTAVSFDEGESWSIVSTILRPAGWTEAFSHCSTNPIGELPYWRQQTFPRNNYFGSDRPHADTGFTLLFDDLKNLDHNTDPCFGVTCGDGLECVDGTCEPIDLCRGVTCGDGLECVDGTCEPIDLCRGVTCGDDLECVDGVCEPIDLCRGVTCGDGLECQEGLCVDIGQPPVQGRLTGYHMLQYNKQYGTAVAPQIGQISINKAYSGIEHVTTIYLHNTCRVDGGTGYVRIEGCSTSKKMRIKNIDKGQWFDFSYTQYTPKHHSSVGDYHGFERGTVGEKSSNFESNWAYEDEIEIFGFDGPMMGGTGILFAKTECVGQLMNHGSTTKLRDTQFRSNTPTHAGFPSNKVIITKASIGKSWVFQFPGAKHEWNELTGDVSYNTLLSLYDCEKLDKVELELGALNSNNEPVSGHWAYPSIWQAQLDYANPDGIKYTFTLLEIGDVPGKSEQYPDKQCWLEVSREYGITAHKIVWHYTDPVPGQA